MARFGAVMRFVAHGGLMAVALTCLAGCREQPCTPRQIELRLSRTEWAPYQAKMRGIAARAASRIRTVSEANSDPHAWNDLAVALHENAVLHDAPELLADSLTACDRALSLDAELPESLFNRALVLEKLGLRDAAREAWSAYLTRDSGPWAAEAREHLRNLERRVSFLGQAERADPAGLRTLARSDPSDARSTGSARILGRWGLAMQKSDTREAERQLAIARELGAELARANGDRMLAQAVAAIDATQDRATLAAAHVDYDDGLVAHQSSRPLEAEALLRRSAVAFARGGSPMSYPARFFAANTLFDQGRYDDARRELEGLLANVPAGFGGLRGQLLMQLGALHTVHSNWGEAIRLLDQGTTILERLGEIDNAAYGHRVQAVIYDRTGNPREAWKHRMLTLCSAGRQSDRNLGRVVASITHAALLDRRWRTAASFLNVQIEIAQRSGDDVQLADALLLRAGVRNRLHDSVGARADLAASADASSRSKDLAYRAYGRAAQSFVRAMLTTSSRESIAWLTEAIAFESTRGDRVNLPGLFLQRGRARRNGGDLAGAAADFESGMSEVETHRESLQQGEARWGVYYSAEELFEDAIDLELHRNDATAAFAIAERARARAILDVYGRSPAADWRRLPARTTVVEYLALPSRLVIFAASADGLTAEVVACDREALAAEATDFAKVLESGEIMKAKSAASALYRRLIEPVASHLIGATTIAFVPDTVTSVVPFGALIDRNGDYLLVQYTVLNAPSAAVLQAASARRAGAPPPRSVLVIAAGEQLHYASAEGERVAREYQKSVVLKNEHARFDALTNDVANADVIHFAGHAIGDDSGFVPASIALERRVEAAEIARLPLRRTSVVVLAGCSTARGAHRGMEGVISVAHGFLAGGAPSVIATLWPIDDTAAATFFPRIHQRLAEGLPPAEAVREAQLESIRRGDVPASLWAAIQDIGS